MADIAIRQNIEQWRKGLRDEVQSQVPFAASRAMNRVGNELIEVLRAHMAAVFDRPTRWTLGAFFLRRSTKRDLVATIERKSAQRGRHYLEVQEAGGPRGQTGMESLIERAGGAMFGDFAGPTTDTPRNSFGNIAPGFLQRMLSQLRVQNDSAQNTTADSLSRSRTADRFFIPPDGQLSRGVWRRRGKKLTKVLHLGVAQPSYVARLSFDETLESEAETRFPEAFLEELQAAIRSRRAPP